MAVILLLQVLVVAHYTSVLVSALAVGPPVPDISSIADIRRNPKISLSFNKGNATLEYLKYSLNEDHQAVWKSIVDSNFENLVTDSHDGMQKALHEDIAYLDSYIFMFQEYGDDCRFYFLPKTQFLGTRSFAFKKGSPLVPKLNRWVLRMKIHGILDKLDESLKRPKECPVESTAIELSTISTPFLLLLFSSFLAVVLCFFEYPQYRTRSTLTIAPPDQSPIHKGANTMRVEPRHALFTRNGPGTAKVHPEMTIISLPGHTESNRNFALNTVNRRSTSEEETTTDNQE